MTSQFPHARRRPTRAKRGNTERNSNIVRASVLETAIELGVGQNSAVANWIFNNPLLEEPEDVYPQPDIQLKVDSRPDPPRDPTGAITPTLTSGSNSTSDESSSLNSPGNTSNAATTTVKVHLPKPSITEPPYVHFTDFSSDQLRLFSPFTLPPHDNHLEGTRRSDADRACSQDDSLRHNSTRENPSPGTDTGYTSEGQYLSKAKAEKGKDKRAKWKNKVSTPKTPDSTKSGEKDGDYASDGGYLSASSNKSLGKSSGKVKSRAMAFFRRRQKKSGRGSDDEDEDYVPPVPAIPILPRPSSPMPLERRAAPSPTRPGFAPLTLNLTSPPTSPSRRQVSKSPPPVYPRAIPPQQSDQVSVTQGPATPLLASTSTPTELTPTTAAATFPLPPSIPGTPLSTASHPASSSSTQLSKSLTHSSSRQHLTIPPPAPPPSLPLPQLPPSPSTPFTGLLPPLPATPTTPTRKGAPTRPVPVVPMTLGPTLPLCPRKAASPFRPLLSPRAPSTPVPPPRVSELLSAPSEVSGRQRSATTGFGGAPAFLQRKIQHGPPPSPRNPPPDMPLPPSPCLNPSPCPRTPIGSQSKFHEHFSSVSSVPLSQVLSTPKLSPSPSMDTLPGSSSGPSLRSSHISSTSERSDGHSTREPLTIPEHSRPMTSASFVSESSYGQPVSSTFGRSFGSGLNLKSHFSDRSDVSLSVYARAMHPGNGSVTTFDDDDADVDDSSPKSCVDDDDDASVYPSDDKTAGRRTMYLLEHGELDENGSGIVISGSDFWSSHEVPPPLPPVRPMPARPGPGYF